MTRMARTLARMTRTLARMTRMARWVAYYSITSTSLGSSNHDQVMKHVQNSGWMWRRGEWPKDPKLGLF